MSYEDDIVYDAILAIDTSIALPQLIERCVHLSGSATGRFYYLRLGVSKFVAEVQYGRVDKAPDLSVHILDNNFDKADSLLEQVILSKQILSIPNTAKNPFSKYHSLSAVSRLIVPIVRDDECLGIIDLDSPKYDHYYRNIQAEIETIGAVILALLEKRSYMDLLAGLSHPLNFHQSLDDFLSELLLLTANACQMPFLIIREYDGKQCLKCIATYGLGYLNMSLFDLDPLNNYPTFQRAVFKKTSVQESTINAVHLQNLQKSEAISQIRSFVAIPIIVGTDMFGVLSLGAAVPHYFSSLEVAGFEAIANAIGVSITNYRNFHLLIQRDIELAQLTPLINVAVVSQAARHEARTFLDDCLMLLAHIKHLKAVKTTKANLSKVSELMDTIEQRLLAISLCLDKIKAASRVPADEFTNSSIKDIWREAFILVTGGLVNHNIRYRITGPDVFATIYTDSLRTAFVQLILNSVDAFREKKIKGNREITVAIEPQSESEHDIKMLYTDNATGIDFSKLYLPHAIDNTMQLEELIFIAGVTSKPGASGYGLYLVRKIMTKHKGRIELVSYMNGVVFNLHLPKHQDFS